uniref:Clp R domain-containing protein n=1 Tax=Aureoumbra lagunensis TaxID=44058 RepID=A0A7S3JRR7_9STRA|mmetsp:Transcript_16415/g.20000  ORF Transcript_16415/g.20000 Transcript_16415/m.20000 type:complete len:878 (+) Transcript_16415:66-2699(+)|eukprot:CAMPEP_0197307564 /NCGR_PEP_ID=MMETSP0891-20130614/5379_1 /TAXON_ID=44058 ORGANISM="Aureoumbra lagunensis, Strain CCMP1510" /NCGR_SAMPLE_ID=MMETSP0891 /ASSEMBLY_ACC=CAM_ASM_000534 /LENGTH=877 /DNA_ID=CAMNT_0042791069 /DNA_START=40 /DNA_END=2673 /DNA_ORIENTATION=+
MDKKFTNASLETIKKALDEAAKQNGHALCEPCHIALCLLENDYGTRILNRANIQESNGLKKDVEERIKKLPKQSPPPLSASLSAASQRLLDRAQRDSKQQGDSFIAQDHLFLALYGEQDVAKILKHHGLDSTSAKKAVDMLRGGKKVESETAEENFDALEKYGIDMIKLAAEGKLDPVIGRDEEIRRVIQILSRRTKNNPVICGPPGVGKTALVEGLAQRIVENDCPQSMRGIGLRTLDMSSLISGAKYRGEFEERLKAVMKEVVESPLPGIILFIDEVHLVLGAGRTDGAMDAANILKPLLARGQLRVIGATTDDEYRKYIEADAAFERRFQKVQVGEPSIEATVAILRGLRDRYESHHGVQILDSALVAAAQLSHRYISGRFLPDKAIDLIDEAASSRRVQLDSKPEELDALERKVAALEIEAISLKREKDEGSKRRLADVKLKIANLKEQLQPLEEQWNQERYRADELRDLQEKLDRLKLKAQVARRNQDFERAADLEYAAIPEVEERLAQLKANLAQQEAMEIDLEPTTGEESIKPLVTESVTPDHVSEVVSRWTGIPVQKLTQSERVRLLSLADRLKTRIVGQDESIAVIAAAILRSRAGLGRANQPLGAFLLCGSTGTGKTLMAKSLAAELFDDSKSALTRLDMSEYSEAHSVARLIGSPPGYVGFDQGGQLTEAVRKSPYVVLLLDEIEKAHPNVLKVLLQLLDEGRLTDSHGRTVDFTQCVVILTSNVGSQYLLAADLSSGTIDDKTKANVHAMLRAQFPPEFLNRLTTTIFNPLGRSHLRQVVFKAAGTLADRLKEHEIDFSISENACEAILDAAQDPQFGARPIERYVESEITTAISQMILAGKISKGRHILVGADPQNSALTYTVN